jgi:demethylmenaquinone methyltransferase/2-methoxy-6-polyprenyl-1,4-benzoquinol methylase
MNGEKMASVKISQNFFDKHSTTWDDDIDDLKLNRIKNIFLNKIPFVKGPILDMGSGTGILIPIFEQLKLKHNIFELDISSKMLLTAKEKYLQKDNVKYIQADAHFLPFINNYFNTVICFQVYPHFLDKNMVTKELYSTLKNHGFLIILHLMGHKELNEFHRQAGREVERDRILPAAKLAELLSTCGFIIKCVEENPDLYLVIGEKNTK